MKTLLKFAVLTLAVTVVLTYGVAVLAIANLAFYFVHPVAAIPALAAGVAAGLLGLDKIFDLALDFFENSDIL
jgi:hypothetical protein